MKAYSPNDFNLDYNSLKNKALDNTKSEYIPPPFSLFKKSINSSSY